MGIPVHCNRNWMNYSYLFFRSPPTPRPIAERLRAARKVALSLFLFLVSLASFFFIFVFFFPLENLFFRRSSSYCIAATEIDVRNYVDGTQSDGAPPEPYAFSSRLNYFQRQRRRALRPRREVANYRRVIFRETGLSRRGGSPGHPRRIAAPFVIALAFRPPPDARARHFFF